MPKSPKAKKVALLVAQVGTHPGLQSRVGGTCPDQVRLLVEHLQAKPSHKTDDPVAVCLTTAPGADGPGYWLVDGHGRVEAYRQAGRKTIPCLVFEGTWADAVTAAARANAGQHARPRTRDDIRHALTMLLELQPRTSGAALADLVRCSQPYANAVKRDFLATRAAAKTVTQTTAIDCTIDDADLSNTGDATQDVDPQYPSVQGDGGVRDVPLADSQLDVADFVWAGINQTKLRTLGEVFDHLKAGGTFGLKKRVLDDLRDQLARQGVGPAAGAAKPARPRTVLSVRHQYDPLADWAVLEDALGKIIRSYERLLKHYPDERKCRETADIGKSLRAAAEDVKVWKTVATHKSKGE